MSGRPPYSTKVLREMAASLAPKPQFRASTGEREMKKDLRNEARRLHPIHIESNRIARLQRSRDLRVARAVVEELRRIWWITEDFQGDCEDLNLADFVAKVRHPSHRGGK